MEEKLRTLNERTESAKRELADAYAARNTIIGGMDRDIPTLHISKHLDLSYPRVWELRAANLSTAGYSFDDLDEAVVRVGQANDVLTRALSERNAYLVEILREGMMTQARAAHILDMAEVQVWRILHDEKEGEG